MRCTRPSVRILFLLLIGPIHYFRLLWCWIAAGFSVAKYCAIFERIHVRNGGLIACGRRTSSRDKTGDAAIIGPTIGSDLPLNSDAVVIGTDGFTVAGRDCCDRRGGPHSIEVGICELQYTTFWYSAQLRSGQSNFGNR